MHSKFFPVFISVLTILQLTKKMQNIVNTFLYPTGYYSTSGEIILIAHGYNAYIVLTFI